MTGEREASCRSCRFNRAADERVGFCALRNVILRAPGWTRCANRQSGSETPSGPIYSVGRHEGEARWIPWHGAWRPLFGASGRCHECYGPCEDGILIEARYGHGHVFCCNDCYVAWWRRQHGHEP